MRGLRIKPAKLAIVIVAVLVVSGVGVWYLLNEISTGATPCAHPTCQLIQEDDSVPVFMITNLSYPVGGLPWDEVQVIMYAYPDDPETYTSVSFWWQPDRYNLTNEDGLAITQSLYNLLGGNDSDLTLICNFTDVEGNGFVDSEDYFTLVPVGEHSLMPGVTYTLKLTYSGTSTMSSLVFVPPDG